MGLRLRQTLILLAGLIVAAVMIGMGLWQMQVFVDQGNRSAADRAQQPPIPLTDGVYPDGSIGDVYGKQLTVTGRYLPDQQVVIEGPDGTLRVLTALQLEDGRVVPVVRGLASGNAPTPAGEITRTGIFLPSEPRADHAVAEEHLGSVRLPLLAQRWPQQLTPGFITLNGADAAAEGLTAARVVLPTEEGSWRNGGYALQWWLFAAFAFGMAVVVARSLEHRARLAASKTVAAGR